MFNGMLAGPLCWARAEGLLAGQLDRIRDEPRPWFRNYAAHPTYHLQGPDHADWAIADLAHIINRLWGVRSAMPVRREVMLIAWDERTVTWAPAVNFSAGPLAGSSQCVVVLTNPEDPQLADYDASTSQPSGHATGCGGPGTPYEALEWLEEHQPVGDEAEVIDRPFLLRYHDDNLLDLPRTPQVAAALSRQDRDGIWCLIRADSPVDAFSHQRQVLADVPGHAPTGECQACPADMPGQGTLNQMLRQCSRVGARGSQRWPPGSRGR